MQISCANELDRTNVIIVKRLMLRTDMTGSKWTKSNYDMCFYDYSDYNLLSFSCSLEYEAVGCYKDTSNRAIQTLEGKDSILDGSYTSRANPIAKCAVAAMRAGYSMFAVQNGGWCAACATAPQTFDKFGKSTACKLDGEGGPWANEVYLMKGKL